MKLSKRLELLAYLVEKHKKGNILADIGTDHAYLPCYLIEKNIIEKAYACDVAKGPFAASLSTIKQYHFEENVEALLGDGLDPILDKEVDMVTIAGMGSFLIVEILEKNKAYLNKVKQFYLQPNANTDHLRKKDIDHEEKNNCDRNRYDTLCRIIYRLRKDRSEAGYCRGKQQRGGKTGRNSGRKRTDRND